MEYFPGKDLRWMMVEKGSITPQETVEIAIQIAEALSFAHENGIVHRDIKPGNIMISDRKVIKVGDFGIAAAADEVSLTSTGQVLGTPEYMAPEQAKGEALDGRADLYALGLVMYKMLTGSSPYEGLSKMAIVGKLIYEKEESALIYKQPVSNQLQQIIQKLIKKDASLRYPTARALIDDLNELRESLMLESAQQKLRHKSGAAEATAALETYAVSKDSVTPFPPMSASPAVSGEPTTALKRSPEMAAAMTSGPMVVTTAPKTKSPTAIGIGVGAAVLAGVLIVYGVWPSHQESKTPSPTVPPSSGAETSPSASMEIQPAAPGAENRPAVPNPPQTPSKKETPNKSSDKKPPGRKTEVAVSRQEAQSPARPAAPAVEPKEAAPREAAIVPPKVETPPPLPPEEIEKEKILAIVKRQENAFESRDVDLYLLDLASVSNEDRKGYVKFFEQYSRIDVKFDIEEIKVTGDSATLKMIQTSRLVLKGRPGEQLKKIKVLWELGRTENNWKILHTKVLEKLG
jgi:serine/threonine protein kinase